MHPVETVTCPEYGINLAFYRRKNKEFEKIYPGKYAKTCQKTGIRTFVLVLLSMSFTLYTASQYKPIDIYFFTDNKIWPIWLAWVVFELIFILMAYVIAYNFQDSKKEDFRRKFIWEDNSSKSVSPPA